MCCPKGKCGCQYFILLTLKKNHGHRGPGFFLENKNLLRLKLKSGLKIEQISGFVNEIYFK
jgi:hypothetical protein